MFTLPRIAMIAAAFYFGGVAGFLGGYLAHSTVLRGYRDEVSELRRRLRLT